MNTDYQLLWVIDVIKDRFSRREMTEAVFLDLARSFDTV